MDFGSVKRVDIDEQMRSAYLDYAMSVIVARALPDARDGLKPVTGAFFLLWRIWGSVPAGATKNRLVSLAKYWVNITRMVTYRFMMPWLVWLRIFPCAICW